MPLHFFGHKINFIFVHYSLRETKYNQRWCRVYNWQNMDFSLLQFANIGYQCEHATKRGKLDIINDELLPLAESGPFLAVWQYSKLC
jgi:hypothetical protein